MYPSTTFYIEDRSKIEDLQINEQINAPLFMQFFTSDKGPEEMREYFGDEFAIFGSPNFARHGQPLLQAQRLINNGARVLAKRVVAPDATLANILVLATVKTANIQKRDKDGNYVFTDAVTGEETTVAEGNTPIYDETKKCEISYELQSLTSDKPTNNMEILKAAALDFYKETAEGEKVFPICLVADNGRGVSSKKFKITANVDGSRTSEYLSYIFTVIENSVPVESTVFTLNPDISSSTSNLSLESVAKTYMKSVRAVSFDEVMVDFIDTVKNATGIEDINNTDILFGKDKKGKSLEVFSIGGESLDIPVGIQLQGGSNGSFGNFPLKSADYTAAMVEAFNGAFTQDVYDVDNIILDAVIDAGYPDEVKKAIESVIDFREDAFFFRDLGTTGLTTTDDILVKASEARNSRHKDKTKFVAIYGNYYDVIDEYTKKQITVTIGYTLAKLLPKHFSEKRHSPVAGQLHGFVFDEIVEGTINFLPKNIPGRKQKDELFEAGVNFISYLDKIATLESEYTTQVQHTGFSYVNNTLAVQEVIKEIRRKCPKTRYSFMEQDDLIKYQEDVQTILNKYASNFGTLEMKYMADPTYEQNMVYYAVLWVRFKKFVQAEVFRIIAINDDDQISTL